MDYKFRDLTSAEINEIASVMKGNRSLKTVKLDWENVDDEDKIVFIESKHKAIVNCKEYLLFECKKANMVVVKSFLQHGTEVALEKDSDGKSPMYHFGFNLKDDES
mgnify:CR=1 FL=1